MPKLSAIQAAAVLLGLSTAAMAQDTDQTELIETGAQAYRICAACHSLHPGLHLSGPSLAGRWGKEAASIEGFGRYTAALQGLEVVWDEDTLNAWLAYPQDMAPGTTMAFRGVENDETRTALIAFLQVAMAEGGHEQVVADGLISQSMADGPIPPDLTDVGENQSVTAIRHCRHAYYVTTADGAQFPFWETNVRLKIDTSERGPNVGEVVLLRSGMAGDRVSVVFPSLAALQEALQEKCE